MKNYLYKFQIGSVWFSVQVEIGFGKTKFQFYEENKELDYQVLHFQAKKVLITDCIKSYFPKAKAIKEIKNWSTPFIFNN